MSQSIKTIIASLSVIPVSKAYLTQGKPVYQSSYLCASGSSLLTDGIFATTNDCSGQAHTNQELNPWMNINLTQSSTIVSVFLLAQQCCTGRVQNTDVRIGNSQTISSNALCKNIDQSGIYCCDTPLTGSKVGVQKNGSDYFAWHEIRAYETAPTTLSESMLSANSMPNATLLNALSLSMTYGQTLGTDAVFSEVTGGLNAYWSVNFGIYQKLKAVLIIGRLASNGESFTADGIGWKVTFGNSANRCTNPTIYTQTDSFGAKEILVESSAQYLAVCKSTGTLSLSLISVFKYPCELDCSAASFTDQVYYIKERTTLTLPACVGTLDPNKTGTLTPTPASEFATLTKHTNNSFTIDLFSEEHSIVGQSYQFQLQFSETTAIEGICQPTAFQIQVKCTKTVDCSASIQSNFAYYITETTTNTIQACVMSPDFCANTSVGTLSSAGATPPDGFAILTKNTDNSFNLTIFSSDATIVGQTYIFTLAFTDPLVTSVTQPTPSTFSVLVKCLPTLIDCSGSGQNAISYFIFDTTTINIQACIVDPSTCENKSTAILTTQGPINPVGFAVPDGFAVLIQNADSSFTITITSNDPLITGHIYIFHLEFQASNGVSVLQPALQTFNVEIKCAKTVNCADSTLFDQIYFITDITQLTVPACVITPNNCPNRTVVTFTSSGVNNPPEGFTTLAKNTNNSFLITISSSNPSFTGEIYQFSLTFTEDQSASVTQSNTPTVNIQVNCTRSVDCSASMLNDFDYYLTDSTQKEIPACIITPSVCINTSSVQLTSTGIITAPSEFFNVNPNTNNPFTVIFSSSDYMLTDKTLQFTFTFINPSVVSVTQPTRRTVNIFVKCTKTVDCSGSGFSNQTLLQTESRAIDNTFVLPACIIVPNICLSTSSLILSSIGTTPSPAGFATATKNADNNSFSLRFLSSDPMIDGTTYYFTLQFSDTAIATVTQPNNPVFEIKVKCTTQIDCSAELKDFVYFLGEEKFIILEACKKTPAYCQDLTQVSFTQMTSEANLISPSPPEKYKFKIFSNDSKLINKKYQQKLEFSNPTTAVIPTINPYPVITVKCKVQEVTHKNNSQANFKYEIGKPAYQLSFLEFEQTPACNFKWTYQLTLVEIKTLTEVVSFTELLIKNPSKEGSMPVGLGRLSQKLVYIKTDDVSLIDKSYAAFISGTLATDPVHQTPLKQNFELARFTIFSQKISIDNSAPLITNFVGEVSVFANESREVVIAELIDVENRAALTITNLKAKCTLNESQWINSSKSTNSKITLVMRVPQQVLDDTCTFEFTVNDNDLKAPLFLTKTVKIIVKAQKFKGVKQVVNQTPITAQIPLIKKSDVNSAGIISLTFDSNLVFPEKFYELTSYNDGPSYFKITLKVNEENLQENGYEQPNQRRLENKDPYHFTWKVQKTGNLNEIKFAFKFDNPQIISKYAKDKIIVSILRPKEFKAFADIRVNLGVEMQNVFFLPQQMQSESEAQFISQTTKAVATALTVVFAGTSIGSIAMSILFVYLMGIINGLQIQALSCLFKVRMPPNAMKIMTKIISLAAFDFFQTEKILNGIFHFQETQSFSQIFDDAGYSGSNFIIGIGPMFIMMFLYVIYLAIRALMLCFFKEEFPFQQDRISQVIQKIVNQFRSHSIESTCITFILEGNIDISLWGFICALQIKKNGIGMPHSSDVFSNIFAFLSMVPLLIAPLHLLYRAWQFNKHIQSAKVKAEVQKAKEKDKKTQKIQVNMELYEELKQENVFNIDFTLDFKEKNEINIAEEEEKKKEEELTETVTEIFEGFKLNLPSLLFYFFFILRRQLMVTVLIFLPTKGLFQCTVHILCSTFILIYAIAYKPYENDLLNFQEICNESFTLLTGYHMLLFTDFIADDETVLNTDKNLKHQLGWSFLAIIGTNLFINVAIIIREVIQEQIKRFRDKKIKRMTLQLEEIRTAQIKRSHDLKNQRIVAIKALRRIKNQENIAAKKERQRILRINRQNRNKNLLTQSLNEIFEERKTVEELKEISEVKQAQIESNSSFQLSSESSDEVKSVRRKVYIERLKEEEEKKQAAGTVQNQTKPAQNQLIRDFTISPRFPQPSQPKNQTLDHKLNALIKKMPVNVSIREIIYPETNQVSTSIVQDTIQEDLLPKVTWPVFLPDASQPTPIEDQNTFYLEQLPQSQTFKQLVVNVQNNSKLFKSQPKTLQQVQRYIQNNMPPNKAQQNQPALIFPSMIKPSQQ